MMTFDANSEKSVDNDRSAETGDMILINFINIFVSPNIRIVDKDLFICYHLSFLQKFVADPDLLFQLFAVISLILLLYSVKL